MSASISAQVLAQLAQRYGIAAEYHDWQGQHVEVAPEVLRAVLAALDVDTSTPEAAEAALRAAEERPWRRTLPPTTVARQGRETDVLVHVPHGRGVSLEIVLEPGADAALGAPPAAVQVEHDAAPREIDGALVGEARFRLPDTLPLGWHELVAHIAEDPAEDASAEGGRSRRRRGGQENRSRLIVAPEAQSVGVEDPAWGIMAQLYQARSDGSWGIGDLRDLQTVGRWGAERDADFVLVNPFHAAAVTTPIEPSPYLPTSRRFADPSLISIGDVIAEFELGLDEASANRIAELASYGRALNRVDKIDRDASWLAKREALTICFDAMRRSGHPGWRDFGFFCEEEGQSLIDFATWCSLCEQHGGDWHEWPEGLRTPQSPEVDAFRQEHSDRVEFYCWVQFVLRGQTLRTQERLREAGMTIGVMHDLAVGVHPHGADAWSLDESLARGVSVGAPPDQYNQLGQNWSQPPLRPDTLERDGYEPLREVLRASFIGAGALRIDHILGMFRQWWIPEGLGPEQGTYVTYDHEAMIGVLLLEAHRAGALVIGEDLGTVSELTREVMAERDVYGTQVMWFERGEDGAPREPRDYRVECLATVTTHDLPPTGGFLELAHIDLRERLGLLAESADEVRVEEEALLAAYRDRLREADLVGENPTTEELVIALHEFMAASVSKLFGVALADLAGDRRAINQPGTSSEYPNWSLPLADARGGVRLVDEILADEHAAALARVSARHNPLKR
ncbi:4-alpha-glucanotransferase [Gulosibacter sp. 10]|uniref:4-alpha-glucanotransferase n=1 Tax=Gulosibacter sp. 10 TaxID=1255570 RepID=UPI00097EB5F5|nr:4-alpha-glucanotransferase [Gulosibacter sp. 10]SJM56635.1 4-alpha-glucanotransferase (amylomaltase) [Gulosibacter sp. 10]